MDEVDTKFRGAVQGARFKGVKVITNLYDIQFFQKN